MCTGYLLIPDALDADMVARLTDVVDRVCDKARGDRELPEYKEVSTIRAVMEDPVMLELLDHPSTFPMAWDVLGWNIQLYISQMLVKPPLPPHYKPPKRAAAGFHQDGGRPNSEMAWDHALGDAREGDWGSPMLTAKFAYFLTDTTVPDCGAM